MYFNFHANRVSNHSKLCTQIYLQKRKLHTFATTISNIKKINYLSHASSCTCTCTCTSIFSKIGLIDQSNSCTQIFLQNNVSYINLQLEIRILKITSFEHALPPNGHAGRF